MPPRNKARTEAKRRAVRAGYAGERMAVLYLRLQGWRILARRFTVKGGEIDVVARRGRTVAFVEVKLRASLNDAFTAIDAAKRRRMGRAARVFVARHARQPGLILRADALYCAPWRWPRHVPAAFELDLD